MNITFLFFFPKLFSTQSFCVVDATNNNINRFFLILFRFVQLDTKHILRIYIYNTMQCYENKFVFNTDKKYNLNIEKRNSYQIINYYYNYFD